MNTPTLTACPRCGGARLLGHPLGLVFWHTEACIFGRAEDARQVADHDLVDAGVVRRPATYTERQLLYAAGADVPDDVETYVEWVSPGARRRWWRDRDGQVIDLDALPDERTDPLDVDAPPAA